MTELTAFNDIETVLMDWLEATFPELAPSSSALHVTSVGAPSSASDYPFVRVTRIAGGDDRITDMSTVDVEVFSPDRSTAFALSETIRARLLGYPIRVSGALIDSVYTETAPTRLVWADPNVHRYQATYQLSARR
jgi:hypothetical protein